MYKSFLLTLVFFASLLVVKSQESIGRTSIGIQGGTAFRTPFKRNSPSILGSSKSENIPGYLLGISFQFNFSNSVTLHSELNYEKLESRITLQSDSPAYYEDVYNYEDEFISLPVFLKFNIFKQKNNCLSIDAGVYGSYLFRTYAQIITLSGQYPTSSFKLKEKVLQDGALTGLCYDYKLDSRMHLIVEVRDYFLIQEPSEKFEFSNSWRCLIGFSYSLNATSKNGLLEDIKYKKL